MIDKKIGFGVFGFIALLVLISLPFALAIEPFGASVTSSAPERAPADVAGTADAFAGNITELSVSGYSNTQTWQGYFGNITGTIQLADAGDNVLYNWSLATPSGEIYGALNDTITWGSIQCFNFTANSSGSAGTAGETNLAGVNLTVLENQFNIANDDVDGVNETFTLIDHDEFYTANLQFSANECRSTRVYSNGGPIDQQFEEVLLYDPNTGSVVFASLIEESSVTGFNGGDNDFEMLVLEDGHGVDVSATTYYFFVELE